MVTVAGNPVLSTPDGARLSEGLADLDFMAAVDIYVNETTHHADVILPPTAALERDHYDLVFHVLAVRNTARFTPAVFPKPEGSRHDWEISGEVARRLAKRLGTKAPLKKRLVSAARMRISPTRTVDLLLRTDKPRLSLRRLRQTPQGLDLGPLRPMLPGRLRTKNRRVDAAPRLILDDLARFEAGTSSSGSPAGVPDDGELLLIGRRHQRDCNSWMHNTTRLTKGRPRHHLLMNPADLAERGIADGTTVAVSSRVGTVHVEVQASEDMMPGVVSLPHGYGHQREGVRLGNASRVPGPSINDLTDPAGLDRASGNAVLNGVPVTVAPSDIDAAGSASEPESAEFVTGRR
jgi:anaerobic selenocysteine-containing dehydrogenase